MPSAPRPLSPHLQVYRPQLTSMLSIAHRLTGIALAGGTLLLVYWLLAASDGPESFAIAQAVIGSWFGYLVLFGWSFALFYHLANGIRHLAWDAGFGFEIEQLYLSGWVVLGAAVGLTVLAWIVGLVALGSQP
jgi:succinate dehydrogenase / fumarate reductase cytochrome b subunit